MPRLSAWWLGLPEADPLDAMVDRIVIPWLEFQNEAPHFEFDAPEPLPAAASATTSGGYGQPEPPIVPSGWTFNPDEWPTGLLPSDRPETDIVVHEWGGPTEPMVAAGLQAPPGLWLDKPPVDESEYPVESGGGGSVGSGSHHDYSGAAGGAIVLLHDGLTFVV